MINPFAEVNWKPDVAARRRFARSLVLGFPCLALLLLVAGWVSKGTWDANLSRALWLGGVGAAVGSVLRLLPQIARPFYVAWYFLACCLGIVLGNLALAGFYYLVLSPFGVCKRVCGKCPVVKAPDRMAISYWKEAAPPPDPNRYYRQF